MQQSFKTFDRTPPDEDSAGPYPVQTDVVHSRVFREKCGDCVSGSGYRNTVLMLYADVVSVAKPRDSSMFVSMDMVQYDLMHTPLVCSPPLSSYTLSALVCSPPLSSYTLSVNPFSYQRQPMKRCAPEALVLDVYRRRAHCD